MRYPSRMDIAAVLQKYNRLMDQMPSLEMRRALVDYAKEGVRAKARYADERSVAV